MEDVTKEWEEWRKKTKKAEAEYREKDLLLQNQIMQRKQVIDGNGLNNRQESE